MSAATPRGLLHGSVTPCHGFSGRHERQPRRLSSLVDHHSLLAIRHISPTPRWWLATAARYRRSGIPERRARVPAFSIGQRARKCSPLGGDTAESTAAAGRIRRYRAHQPASPAALRLVRRHEWHRTDGRWGTHNRSLGSRWWLMTYALQNWSRAGETPTPFSTIEEARAAVRPPLVEEGEEWSISTELPAPGQVGSRGALDRGVGPIRE